MVSELRHLQDGFFTKGDLPGWSPQKLLEIGCPGMPPKNAKKSLGLGINYRTRGSDKGHKVAEISTLIFFQKIKIDLENPSPVVICDKSDV